jgi:hypothetical protein
VEDEDLGLVNHGAQTFNPQTLDGYPYIGKSATKFITYRCFPAHEIAPAKARFSFLMATKKSDPRNLV